MLTNAEFLQYVLDGGGTQVPSPAAPSAAPLPEGFEGFETAPSPRPAAAGGTGTFARRLLEAAGFGYAELVQRESVIRSTDAVARYLPDRASYWPKTSGRPYQTLLFETSLTHRELLAIPAFRSRALSHLDIVEDALARLASEALEGFQRGGEGVTADVRKGRKEETLCIISIVDEREAQPVRLVCFGTWSKRPEGGLETFQITEQARFWDRQLAREHLGLLYERQFRKLEGHDWQEAFTTTEERKQAERLLEVCTRKTPQEHDIQESVLDLLDIIAKGFGLRKRPKTERRLQAFDLPSDHDIGIDPEERESRFGGKNPFGGVTLRDERSRLLGYIVYPLRTKTDAARLRKHLEENNRFHNVLVVYPDVDQASLELWQGREQLTGKLRKGQGHKDAADVVNLLSRFFVVSKARVRNPTELAQELAYRARYLRRLAVKQLEDEKEKGPLRNLYTAFKEALVHDQTEDEFADAFAQTITYGLLTARWTGNDQLVADGERLTRQSALKHLPAASPFLTDLFKSALFVRLDEQRGRLLWLVDDIADLLDRIDVAYVFGAGDRESDTATDPVIHFYEPFLAAYDKNLKNKRGVFFTPRPVVSYIVRSVHEVLQKEFGLADGLASTDTWGEVAKRIDELRIPDGVKATDSFVSILDPATGTGTFLFECIEVIERTMKDRWCRERGIHDWKSPAVVAMWNRYVSEHLLPRVYGYELMMASYAVAHLKLWFKLRETGFRPGPTDRLNVYLTNSLEPPTASADPRLADLFATLAHEARDVNAIKLSRRFTVIVGNPPYAGHSENNQVEWIVDRVYDYKRGFADLQKPGQAKWLQDDYVKFIRLAEYLLEAVPAGVLGFITNHSFLDNPTFKGMRRHLGDRFGRISLLDLHGNSKKRERAADGTLDENVFEIQQGVAVMVARRGPGAKLVEHRDLLGSREKKYEWLAKHSADDRGCRAIVPAPESYLFRPQDATFGDEYGAFLPLDECMGENGDPAPGVVTTHDEFAISWTRTESAEKVDLLLGTQSEAEARGHFTLCSQSQWSYARAKAALANGAWRKQIVRILYRPFDWRWTVFDSNVAVHRRERVMRHMLGGKNMGLICTRQTKDQWGVFATREICAHKTCGAYDINFLFPLELHSESDGLRLGPRGPRPNISKATFERFRQELKAGPKEVTAERLFQYFYGIFHSREYRRRYAEPLKSAFPRIPVPRSDALFSAIADYGQELLALHLLEFEGDRISEAFARRVGPPSPEVEKPAYADGAVWLDKGRSSGFTDVPVDVWEARIGGFQVCDKWLKDRKGRKLSKTDVEQYRRIMFALKETNRIMAEIDKPVLRYGGWPGAFAGKASGGAK